MGDELHARARTLADDVLADPRVALAQRILERGPHWVRAAIDLAESSLRTNAVETIAKEAAK